MAEPTKVFHAVFASPDPKLPLRRVTIEARDISEALLLLEQKHGPNTIFSLHAANDSDRRGQNESQRDAREVAHHVRMLHARRLAQIERVWWFNLGKNAVPILAGVIADPHSSELQVINAINQIGSLRPRYYERDLVYSALSAIADTSSAGVAQAMIAHLLIDLRFYRLEQDDPNLRTQAISLVQRALPRCKDRAQEAFARSLDRLQR